MWRNYSESMREDNFDATVNPDRQSNSFDLSMVWQDTNWYSADNMTQYLRSLNNLFRFHGRGYPDTYWIKWTISRSNSPQLTAQGDLSWLSGYELSPLWLQFEFFKSTFSFSTIPSFSFCFYFMFSPFEWSLPGYSPYQSSQRIVCTTFSWLSPSISPLRTGAAGYSILFSLLFLFYNIMNDNEMKSIFFSDSENIVQFSSDSPRPSFALKGDGNKSILFGKLNFI